MDISLTPKFENLVREKVASGGYNSPGEVVQEALALLRERDEFQDLRLVELRREIAIGLEESERGESAPLDIEAVKVEGRKRLIQAVKD